MGKLGAITHVPGPGEQLSAQLQLPGFAAFRSRFQVTAGSAQRIAPGPRVGGRLGGAGASVGTYGESSVTHEADTLEGPAAHLDVDNGLGEGPYDSGYHLGDGRRRSKPASSIPRPGRGRRWRRPARRSGSWVSRSSCRRSSRGTTRWPRPTPSSRSRACFPRD